MILKLTEEAYAAHAGISRRQARRRRVDGKVQTLRSGPSRNAPHVYLVEVPDVDPAAVKAMEAELAERRAITDGSPAERVVGLAQLAAQLQQPQPSQASPAELEELKRQAHVASNSRIEFPRGMSVGPDGVLRWSG